MKSGVSSTLRSQLASDEFFPAQCLFVVLKNAITIGFTSHDQTIVISGWTGDNAMFNGTYLSLQGFEATAVQTSAALNVDTTEVSGPSLVPNIIESELIAGLWDFASFWLFTINYTSHGNAVGPLFQRTGKIGEVTLEGNRFKAEIRGLMQEYTKTLCELTSPGCRANFGDVRCSVDLGPHTYLGTVSSVNADNQTFYDTSLVSGATTGGVPPGAAAILSITNANPGIVTLASNLNLIQDQAVQISGVVGMTPINVVTTAHNPTFSAPFTFELTVDTSDTALFPPYISGGYVAPFGGTGATAGFFDGGKVTFNSGLNNTLSEEVKSYTPGQVNLILPMPFLIAPGDTFTIIRGCAKTLQACRDYNNIVNFVGEPFLRGIDQLIQVGRHL